MGVGMRVDKVRQGGMDIQMDMDLVKEEGTVT